MTDSEKQLKDFLQFKKDGGFKIRLKLKPQGDFTTIEPEAINLCEVHILNNEYLFGGIREDFFHDMFELYS